jgi:hypothetical protein
MYTYFYQQKFAQPAPLASYIDIVVLCSIYFFYISSRVGYAGRFGSVKKHNGCAKPERDTNYKHVMVQRKFQCSISGPRSIWAFVVRIRIRNYLYGFGSGLNPFVNKQKIEENLDFNR